MKGQRYKKKGWFGEPNRHSLAAKGIRTKYNFPRLHFAKKNSNKTKKKMQTYMEHKGIPIMAEEPKEGRIFPISPSDVKEVFENQKDNDLEGIKAVEFVNPKGVQKEAWGQYVRSRNTILIFSQPEKNGKVDDMDPGVVQDILKNYVIPHEVGHHKALEIENITDEDMSVAEARADANVHGLEPTDKEVVALARMR